MMKRMLFSVALLMAAGTVALLGSPANTQTLTPITLTNAIQDQISGSQWDGEWYGGGFGGDAGLYLVIGYGHADARFSIQSDPVDTTFRARGTVKGNTMKLKTGRINVISLSLYREEGKLVLKGEYEVMSGEYSGNTGTYYFVKRAE